jgi:hypothetical protein
MSRPERNPWSDDPDDPLSVVGAGGTDGASQQTRVLGTIPTSRQLGWRERYDPDVFWSVGFDVLEHYRRLAALYRELGFADEVVRIERRLAHLEERRQGRIRTRVRAGEPDDSTKIVGIARSGTDESRMLVMLKTSSENLPVSEWFGQVSAGDLTRLD